MLARALLLFALPALAHAHAIDDRYELPVPLSVFIVGATSAVAVSFLIAALCLRRPPTPDASHGRAISAGPVLFVLRPLAGLLSVLVFGVTLAAALFGTRDPMMNLAPTMVWVVWWVGLSLFVACVGNVWPALDPWRAVFNVVDAAARALGSRNGISLGLPYPKVIGAWPAVVLLLLLGWLEVGYPESAEPRRIAQGLLAWSGIALLGRVVFGRETWERNADAFSLYFATLGRFAPLAAGPDDRTLLVRAPGRGLLVNAPSIAAVALVMAMLATVLFDGLLSGQTWWSVQAALIRAIPALAHPRGYFTSPLGLLGVWLVFLAAYYLACAAAARLTRATSIRATFRAFAYTLVPIAVGYSIAHNFSSLLIQGQQVISLFSDPLSLDWDVLGTRGYRPYMRLIEAAGSWYVAVAAIVLGHAIAVWLAHRVALRDFGSPRRAVVATLPLTLAMLIYTAVSLAVIAEPMVKHEGIPQQNELE
jgi:hypothetical protein